VSNNLYMPFHPTDYLTDTAYLRTAQEHGAYLLLLINYWQSGNPLPDDDRKLAAIAKVTDAEWAAISPAIREFFQARDGRLYHKRVEAELKKAREKSQAARDAVNSRKTNPPKNAGSSTDKHPIIDRSSNQDQVKEQEDANASSPRAISEVAEFRQNIWREFERAGSPNKPDTSRAAIWMERGWKPAICLAVIGEILARKKSVSSLTYFENAIADAHQAPKANPANAPKPYASPVVSRGQWVPEPSPGGQAWLSRYPGTWKSKREERNGEWGAMMPTEFPPANGAAA
jgi:uncharacterized protein YdaU (DUF1376 family)